MKQLSIGGAVVYVDEFGQERPALVTQNWGTSEYDPEKGGPAINVVFVSNSDKETDTYGRQMKHETSVVHRAQQMAHGKYWFQP